MYLSAKFNLCCRAVTVARQSPPVSPGLDETSVLSGTDFGGVMAEISLLSEFKYMQRGHLLSIW